MFFSLQVHLGRQEQIRLKALRESEQLAADIEQARLDKEGFLAEEAREREKEMRKRQVRPAQGSNGFAAAREHSKERSLLDANTCRSLFVTSGLATPSA